MAQINAPKPLLTERQEEDQDQLQSAYVRSMTFYEQYKTALIGGAVALVALIAALVGWSVWKNNQAEAAQKQLGSILSYYEQGDFETALQGTDTQPGLLEIADRTGDASSAPFFAADALYQLGRFDEALEYFQKTDGDGLIGASALAGQAAVYEQRGEHEQAASLYERAAGAYDSPATTPGYLLDAARAHYDAGSAGAAQEIIERVLTDFPDAPEATAAEVLAGQIEAGAQGS